MKIIELLQDYNIDFVTEGHRHARPGWVNIICPFCSGNPGYHLGFNQDDEYFYCWRCGWHSNSEAIAGILPTTIKKSKEIIKQYEGVNKTSHTSTTKVNINPLKMPSGTFEPELRHKKYLRSRGFNPKKTINEFGLLATGPIATLDETDYKFRIIAPFYWNGGLVSFQARDITGKSDKRYLACPKQREVYHHKHILYGNQERWGRKIMIVEGITDVWALGAEHAAATLGIEYTWQQVSIIAKYFDSVCIAYDNDPQAVRQGKKLRRELQAAGVDATQIVLEKDPASMNKNERMELVNQ